MTHGKERDREINAPNIKNDFNVNGKLFKGWKAVCKIRQIYIFIKSNLYSWYKYRITIEHSYNFIMIVVQLRLPNVSKPTKVSNLTS